MESENPKEINDQLIEVYRARSVMSSRPPVPQVRPWIRYWARTLDYGIFGLTIGVCIGLVNPELAKMNAILLNMVILVLWIPCEAGFLRLWNTTPGKLILNIELKNSGSVRVSYGKALSRSFDVWLRGMAAGIPIVSLFSQYLAYDRLTKHNVTTWDTDEGFVIKHHEISFGRGVLAVVLLFGICMALLVQRFKNFA
ncbi:MAG: RDD family protein [Candidatus Zixiibacteriota bacterium]